MAAYRPPHELLDEFAATLVGMSYDGISVLEATAEINVWDEEGVYVTLVLSDPPAGRLTWPLQPLEEMQRVTRNRAEQAGIEQFVTMRMTSRPEEDDDPEPARPPGPSRARIATSEERFPQA